jgi:pyridoxamine 5'-phosphate oxidase-like protein
VRRLFEARRHKTLATVRRDGSPRISGIEVQFEGGDAVMGMMPGSMKLLDVRRDPRLAVHISSADPPEDDPSAWAGDAKISGVAIERPDPEKPGEPSNSFRIDIKEVSLVKVGKPADHLVIESWHEGRGLQRRKRH